MAQYYQIISTTNNVDELKQLNFENCVLVNEDGHQIGNFSPRSVTISKRPLQMFAINLECHTNGVVGHFFFALHQR